MYQKEYPEDDSSLVQLFQRGDNNAFSKLYNKYKTNLFRYFVKLSGNEHDAEDIMQEVLIRVMIAINAGKYQNNNFPGWLTVIGYNYFVNNYRKSKKHPIIHPDDITVHIKEIETSPEQMLIKNESGDIFNQKINSLPESLKDVMHLWLDDIPYTKASEILNIKLGTYKSRAFIARKELKKHYV